MTNNIESPHTEINPEELAKNEIQKQIEDKIVNHYNKSYKDGSPTLEEYTRLSLEEIKSDVSLKFLFKDDRKFTANRILGAKAIKDIEKVLQSSKN